MSGRGRWGLDPERRPGFVSVGGAVFEKLKVETSSDMVSILPPNFLNHD